MAWLRAQSSKLALIIGLIVSRCQAAFDITYVDDSDLSTFVTRPEIRAPRLIVDQYDHSSVNDLYFFASPYAQLYQQKPAPGYYEACQTGPHIYDSSGELVWSGACMFRNKNVADFRSTRLANGSFVLSGIQLELEADDTSRYGDGKTRGRGMVIDNTYQEQAVVEAPANTHSFNMHELKLVDGGKSALHLLWKPEYLDVSQLAMDDRKAGWVGIMGFREVDLTTGDTVFEWWSLDRIALNESTWRAINIEGPAPNAWDYLHANSIDKTPEGDYLFSARHTDCIYRISGRDKSILWRLGGKSSSFELRDLTFKRQHDARAIQAESLDLPKEEGIEYITLFNNAADEQTMNPSPSSALVVRLDLSTMQATAVRHITRADGGSTPISGNCQILDNGNTLTSWGSNSNISEYDPQGRLVAEARFASNRFANYRTYKLNWRAQPLDAELALACSVYGTSSGKATTVCHVSWNGATEVSHWRFHTAESASEPARVMASVAKTGFETKIESTGYSRFVHVEGLSSNGDILGTSSQVVVESPKDWVVRTRHRDL